MTIEELQARVEALEANSLAASVYETQWGVQRTNDLPAGRTQVQIQKLSIGPVKPGDIIVSSGCYSSGTLPKSQLDPDYTQVTGRLFLSSDPAATGQFDEPARWCRAISVGGGPNVIWEQNHARHEQVGITIIDRSADEAWLIEVGGSGQGAQIDAGYARIAALVLRKPMIIPII